jgi:hypothetical protein
MVIPQVFLGALVSRPPIGVGVQMGVKVVAVQIRVVSVTA